MQFDSKKIRVLSAAVLAVFSISLCSFADPSQPREAGLTISERRGPGVEFLRRGRETWADVRQGLIMYSGDKVRTNSDSQIELKLDGAGSVRLRELSSLTVSVDNANTPRQIRNVRIEGTAWFSTNVPKGKFIVSAGNGRISSTKAVFKIEKTQDSLVAITCFQGNLLIQSHGDETVLTGGRQTVYSERTPPIEPRSSLVPPATLIDWVKRRETALAGKPEAFPDDEAAGKIRRIEEKQVLSEEPYVAKITPDPDHILSGNLRITDVKVSDIPMDGFHDGQILNRGNLENGKIVVTGETRATIQPVARVDVSLDNGVTWTAAEGTKKFRFSFIPRDGSCYQMRIRAMDKYSSSSDITHSIFIFHYRHETDDKTLRRRLKRLLEHYEEQEYLKMDELIHPEATFDWKLSRFGYEMTGNSKMIRYTIRRLWIEKREARIEFDWRVSDRTALSWTKGHTVVMLKKSTRDNQWYFHTMLMDTGLF